MTTSILCPNCGHEWIYKGHSSYRASCPKCKKPIVINPNNIKTHSVILDLDKHKDLLLYLIKQGHHKLILDHAGNNVIQINTID